MSELLDARERTHGPFKETAFIYCQLSNALRGLDESGNGTFEILAALDAISMKLARIAAGNCMEPDHWRDIQGYCELALRSIEEANK